MTFRAGACLLIAGLLAAAPAAAAGAPDDQYPSDEALRHYLAGRWLVETGDLPGAEGEFTRAMALQPDVVELMLRASEVAARQGQPGRALELARRALARDPNSARAQWLEGAALFNLERPADALAPLRAAVAADTTNAEYLHTLAHTAESLDQVALVDSCYARLVQVDEDDAESWFQLATARAREGRYAEADSALTIAIADNPERPGELFLRGFLRERLGHPEEAVTLYRHHLEAHPKDMATRRRLVALLAMHDHIADALVEARTVVAADPRDASALQVEAELEFRAGRPAEGDRTLAKLRALAPDDPDMVAHCAEVLLRGDRAREARQLVDGWAVPRGEESHALMLRAWVRAAGGQPDSASFWARRVVDAQPDSLAPRLALARYLREGQHWPDAIVQLEWLHHHEPTDPGVLLDLGLCREQTGDLEGAIQAGRDALDLAPDAATIQNFLGYLLADHDRDLPEAEKLIRSALEQEPDNGAYVDSMGWLLFRRGELEPARAQLERAVELTGGDPVIREHLGDVYRELKRPDLARDQYRLSLKRDSGNHRVQAKLEGLR